MSLCLSAQSTPFKAKPNVFVEIIHSLKEEGYRPLLTEAREKFISVVAGSCDSLNPNVIDDDEQLYRYRVLSGSFRHERRLLVSGELLVPTSGQGMLYLAVFSGSARGVQGKGSSDNHLEAGFMGPKEIENGLTEFLPSISRAVRNHAGHDAMWTPLEISSEQFSNLSQDKELRFVRGTDLPDEDVKTSAILADPVLRDFALSIKRSGGILAADSLKKASGLSAEQHSQIIRSLEEGNLVTQEYVIICRRTSNQVNRIGSREKLEAMRQLGVLCSCGNSIASERVEELIVPTSRLKRMLDQSYWMSAQLLLNLANLDIPRDKVLLNLQEGADEIDAFVDVEGKLLMFELKDNEFSMGHAYPFGGRVGLYKPDYGIIVATKGIAPDVKDYFKRVKPEADLVYVPDVNGLAGALTNVIDNIRSERASNLLRDFDPLTQLKMSLQKMVFTRMKAEKQQPAIVAEKGVLTT
jgi:hypothetical protein